MSRPSAEDPVPVHAAPAPALAVPLRAGPLRVVFDRGELRWIRLGEREVLRGIYFGLRGESWVTVTPELEDLVIEAEPDSFRIRFVARHARGPIRYAWEGSVWGRADGRIEFAIQGTAGSSFPRNRLGLCVLHPVEACAGRPCIVELVDGDRAESAFPARVAPRQPFRNVRAILHEVSPGVEAEVRMEGETFETEDQCNWGDTSFKTYGTPIHLPFPVQVDAGAHLAQSVSVSLFGISAAPVEQAAARVPGAVHRKRNSSEPVVVAIAPDEAFALPAIGLGGADRVGLGSAEAERVRSLRLAHLRADLRLEAAGWDARLERAVANASLAGVPLELAIFLPDDPRRALEQLAAAGRQAAAVRRELARVPGGRRRHGGGPGPAGARGALGRGSGRALRGRVGRALRRAQPPPADPGPARQARLRLSPASPRVRRRDDRREPRQPAARGRHAAQLQRRSALRDLAGDAALARRPEPGVVARPARSPFTDDQRQPTPFAAAWTLGLLAVGGRGRLREPDPVRARRPARRAGRRSRVPGAARARRRRGARRRARRAGPAAPARSASRRWRCARAGRCDCSSPTSRARRTRCASTASPGRLRRAALGQSESEDAGLELELGPHEIVRLDVELGLTGPA